MIPKGFCNLNIAGEVPHTDSVEGGAPSKKEKEQGFFLAVNVCAVLICTRVLRTGQEAVGAGQEHGSGAQAQCRLAKQKTRNSHSPFEKSQTRRKCEAHLPRTSA